MHIAFLFNKIKSESINEIKVDVRPTHDLMCSFQCYIGFYEMTVIVVV